MSDIFCALCGVPFELVSESYDDSYHPDDYEWFWFKWVKSFRVVKKDSESEQWYISKPLYHMSAEGAGFAPPPGHENTDGDGDDAGEQTEHIEEENFVCFSARKPDLYIAYPVHTICHDSMLQTFASISTARPPGASEIGTFLSAQKTAGNGRGLNPTWSNIGYGGAEQFWRDSWAWLEEPVFSDDEYSSRPYEWDFLICDSSNLECFDDTFCTPPVLPATTQSPSVGLDSDTTHGTDFEMFSRLPVEVTENILSFLPTQCVYALRLASRTIASRGLSPRFWKSRFDYPHELNYIPLNLLGTPSSEAQIDWKALYLKLLRPDANEALMYMEKPDRSRRNRQRLTAIIRQFCEAVLKDSDHNSHKAVNNDPFSTFPFRKKTLSCNLPLVTGRSKIHFLSAAHANSINEIVVSCEQMRDGKSAQILDGLEFHSTSYPTRCLGRFHGESTCGSSDTHEIEEGRTLAGFYAGLSEEGVTELVLITQDENGNSNEQEVVDYQSKNGSAEVWGVLSLSPGAALEGFEATFFGDWLTSLTLIERVSDATFTNIDIAQINELRWSGPPPPRHLVLAPHITSPYDVHKNKFSYFLHQLLPNLNSSKQEHSQESPQRITFEFDEEEYSADQFRKLGKRVKEFPWREGEYIAGVDLLYEEDCEGLWGIEILTNNPPEPESELPSTSRQNHHIPIQEGTRLGGFYWRVVPESTPYYRGPRRDQRPRGIGLLLEKRIG